MEARLKQIEYKSMEGLRRVIAERQVTSLPSILTLPLIAERVQNVSEVEIDQPAKLVKHGLMSP